MVFLWSRSMMLGSAESEHPRLTNREIIFEDLIPTYVITTPHRHGRTNGPTDGQTDRRTTLP